MASLPASAAPAGARPSSSRSWVGLGLLLLAADLGTKALAHAQLMPGAPVAVLGDWVRLTMVPNPGGPFGLSLGSWNVPLFSLAALFSVLVTVVLWREALDRRLRLALVLVVAGGLGNALERLALGAVTDFVDLGMGAMRFWTFNVADVWLTLGVLLAFLATPPARVADPADPKPVAPPRDLPEEPSASVRARYALQRDAVR